MVASVPELVNLTLSKDGIRPISTLEKEIWLSVGTLKAVPLDA